MPNATVRDALTTYNLKHSAYIDTRGPWPVLVSGQAAVELRGCKRDITVEEAVTFLFPQRLTAITTDLNLPIATE